MEASSLVVFFSSLSVIICVCCGCSFCLYLSSFFSERREGQREREREGDREGERERETRRVGPPKAGHKYIEVAYEYLTFQVG